MNDLISRQATIDAMENVDWYHISKDGQLVHGANSKEDEPLYKAKDVYVVLNKMPSAETHDKRTETHSCDLISRQAAIDTLDKHLRTTDVPVSYPGIISALTEWLNELPSAQADSKETSSTHKALDTISRQAAIDAVYKCADIFAGDMPVMVVKADAYEALAQLPSAQSEPIRINLNEPIKVKLTDWGKEIYYHQYDRTNQIAGREICKPMFPREDENGYTEFQLWCFIELYGMHMGMTLPNVIEPLEIVYER